MKREILKKYKSYNLGERGYIPFDWPDKVPEEYKNWDYLFFYCNTGGAKGGGCFGGAAEEYSSNESLDTSDLDDILTEVCPQISFLKYKVLMKELDKRAFSGEQSHYEYYGNRNDYKYKIILIKDLEDCIEKVFGQENKHSLRNQ